VTPPEASHLFLSHFVLALLPEFPDSGRCLRCWEKYGSPPPAAAAAAAAPLFTLCEGDSLRDGCIGGGGGGFEAGGGLVGIGGGSLCGCGGLAGSRLGGVTKDGRGTHEADEASPLVGAVLGFALVALGLWPASLGPPGVGGLAADPGLEADPGGGGLEAEPQKSLKRGAPALRSSRCAPRALKA